MLTGRLRLRVRDICRQARRENGVDILRRVLSSDHVHMFVSVPPKLAFSDLVRKMCIDPAKTRSFYQGERGNEYDDRRQHQTLDGEGKTARVSTLPISAKSGCCRLCHIGRRDRPLGPF